MNDIDETPEEEVKDGAVTAAAAEPEVEDMSVTEEVRDIAYVRGKRRQIVKEIMKDGKVPVSDPKQMGSLLTVLNDMDRTSLGRMRIKAETTGNAAAAQSAAIIADALNQLRSSLGAAPLAPVAPRTPPTLPDELSGGNFTDANRKIGTINGTFDEFSAANPNKGNMGGNAAP